MRAGIVLTFVVTALASLAAGCGGSEPADEVVAAFYPIALAAGRVAPGLTVENVTPAGAEPHDLELSARDAERIRDAATVLYFGRGFMPALEAAVEGGANAVDLLEGEQLLAVPGGSAPDPHLWLDPRRYATMARRIATVLGDAARADAFVAGLEGLDRDFRAGLATCERRQLVTSHAAFGYLADAYDLEQIPLTGVSPEAEPGARDLEGLVAEVERSAATTVFVEPLVSAELGETIAREAGVAVAVLDPLEGLAEDRVAEGADYFTVMRENLAALRKALGCR